MMRAQIIRAPAAAKMLLSLLPLLKVQASQEIPRCTFDDDQRVTWLLRRAMEDESLETLLNASEVERMTIIRRIHAFALTANHDPKKVIARLAGNSDDRTKLFAAMYAISHQAPFDYLKRFREEHKKDRSLP